MFEIIYNGEVINTANNTYDACDMVSEGLTMMYYITVDGVCKHMTNDVNDVNNWLKKHNKHIKNIYAKNWNKEVIVEVK